MRNFPLGILVVDRSGKEKKVHQDDGDFRPPSGPSFAPKRKPVHLPTG